MTARSPITPEHHAECALSVSGLEAVVFDMDGVITDTTGAHRRAWKQTLDRFLAEDSEHSGRRHQAFGDDDYVRYVDGKHRDDGVVSFLTSRRIALPDGSPGDSPDVPTVWGLANRKDEVFRRLIAVEGVQAFPTSVDLVGVLQRHGLGTAITSASRNCRAVLRAAGVAELFQVVVDGVDAANLRLPGKPSPAVFLEAARQMGADPTRTAVVEDAVAGVRAGNDGHFGLVVGVDRTGCAALLRAAGADVVVTDLGELRVVP